MVMLSQLSDGCFLVCVKGTFWFQQNGATPHYGRRVMDFLNQMFPGRWIRRKGNIEWPARSPDLNPLDFFLPNHFNKSGHVFGQCPKGELLIIARHQRVRHALAISLKTLNWEIHEEVHCVSSDGSFRRADIIAINGRLKRALVLDPTIRFERNLNQATEVDIEKKSIYEPCLPYLSQKYNVPFKQWSVIGLLFGSRGSITKFTWNYLKELHIPFDYLRTVPPPKYTPHQHSVNHNCQLYRPYSATNVRHSHLRFPLLISHAKNGGADYAAAAAAADDDDDDNMNYLMS
ncbi:hypothetical protein ANN_21054 [Periplaneta americana]|uniref:Uncharacterized protein n=1 Tax=Periplaneta americana TaxID=6978 RepID=A0ABQ8SFF5_PERAM|nr:hypothetical protein ANN_21054 [Periplaneta americana]